MDVKSALLKFITQSYIIELILSKVFSASKRFAFQQMEHALEQIEKYLLEKKEKFEKTPSKYDEEILKLGISGLQEFSKTLNEVLNKVQN